MRWSLRCLVLAVLVFVYPALGEEASLLILHTNDVHDHVRAGYEGLGGLPYVSGFVADVKSKRDDVLLLDGGDVTEKGDMAAFVSDSRISYSAMDRIGYDMVAVGNHERKHGIAHLRACQEQMKQTPILCLNWPDEQGKLVFPGSKVFTVHGVKVGVIGLTLPEGKDVLNVADTGAALAHEAERLKGETDIQVAVGHLGSKMAEVLSGMAPEVDVFVTAHTHELLQKPVIAKKTGAIIVQAGMYAWRVGWLELKVDLAAKKVVSYEGKVVEMRHDAVPCDTGLRDWVMAQEKELCPDAGRVVGHSAKQVRSTDMAKLAAVALAQRAGVDIGLCNTRQTLRSALPAGDVDVNALFSTGGQRGHKLVQMTLTGQQIEAYMLAMLQTGKGITQWSGFKATITPGNKNAGWGVASDLKADKGYRVVMPLLEWETGYVKEMKDKGPLPAVEACSFSWTDAVAQYVEGVTKSGKTIDAAAMSLGAAGNGNGSEEEEKDK